MKNINVVRACKWAMGFCIVGATAVSGWGQTTGDSSTCKVTASTGKDEKLSHADSLKKADRLMNARRALAAPDMGIVVKKDTVVAPSKKTKPKKDSP